MNPTTLLIKLLRAVVLISAATFGATTGLAQSSGTPKQAELTRSTTGRGIDSSGFASISIPLQKGAIYDVVRQENGNVVISVDGKNVVVQTGAVSLSEKPDTPVAGINGFVPGKIVIVSAKYSIDGNQPRNVKNNLQKLVPQTIVTEPVVIIVTDALSPAAQEQGIVTQGTVKVTSGTTANILMRTASKNVLTVEYIFNGKRFTKQVPEGAKLVLP